MSGGVSDSIECFSEFSQGVAFSHCLSANVVFAFLPRNFVSLLGSPRPTKFLVFTLPPSLLCLSWAHFEFQISYLPPASTIVLFVVSDTTLYSSSP